MKREDQLALKKAGYEGIIFKTNNYGDVVVLEYNNAIDITIKFLNTGNVRKTATSELRKGKIRDNEAFPVHKVCIMDIPKELNMMVGKAREYIVWNSMRQRCYNENTGKSYENYKNVEVSDYFKYYSNFKIWCSNQIGFNIEGFELDKDILVKGNKVYAPETCCFVPKEINTMFTNSRRCRGAYPVGVYYKKRISKYVSRISKYGEVIHLGNFDTPEEAFQTYKLEKEKHIKEIANKWKDQIDPRVYEALMNWTVEITD